MAGAGIRKVKSNCAICPNFCGIGKVDQIGKDQEYTPACDVVCPVQARLFGDMYDRTAKS